ncbi:MAG TPA: DnaJ C-terminal domain-containing protein, partial [Magnetospirillum sp.]|nr:DnaJ C-terminal domain-containing protein [Magnetospirillum sp.]
AGTTKRVTLMSGKSLDVRIPPGTTDGQTLRLKSQGHPGIGGDGDAFIDIKVDLPSHFTKRDQDVLLDLPISVQEAVMGGKVTVPTIDGKVMITIPPGSNTGAVLRLKGKGLAGSGGARGDQLVTLKVVLPENDPEFRKMVEKWGPRHGYDPRAKTGLG